MSPACQVRGVLFQDSFPLPGLQLLSAVVDGRTIYTTNVGDFARLHSTWQRAGLHRAGIAVLTTQRTPIGIQLRALIRLATALEPEAMQGRLEFLSNWFRE